MGMTFGEMMAALKEERRIRRRPSDREHRLQCACVRWFALKYPELKGRLFAVPNGGRRDETTAAKLKAEGVVAGVSDLILLKSNKDYGALLIEMKREDGRQSRSQRLWESAVCGDGEYKYVVCHSLDEFQREVTDYLTRQPVEKQFKTE